MKLNSVDASGEVFSFKGKRTSKIAVTQLSSNNAYSLTEPNQRRIANAITDLSKVKGVKNIKFLLETAAKSTYSTNIRLKDMPKHDWKGMLLAAAASAIALTASVSKTIMKKFDDIKNSEQLTDEEKEILNLRESLLQSVDTKQIENETISTTKDFEKNLDYFIVSSETTLAHKKYVLERLNYFMSDEYEINPQLKDKKSIVAAEMINDMAIHTPSNKIPNIKAVNQKQHGMCAAIAIVRKMLAYEDKPNYVDSIISELDSSDEITAYDRSELGTGKKTKVKKVPVDFETALAQGYRIIDASTMHWMQIAQMGGSANIAYNVYNPFDKENFDTKADSFFNVKIDDDESEKKQNYYQALLKAKSVIGDYKAEKIKDSVEQEDIHFSYIKTIENMSKITNNLREIISPLHNEFSENEVHSIITGLYNLEHQYSDKIVKGNTFAYIPNEEAIVKKEKIRNYLLSNPKIKNISDSNVDKIFDLVEFYNEYKKSINTTKLSKIQKATKLYEVAAAFRYQVTEALKIDEKLENYMISEKITNRENLLLQTLDTIIEELENNSPNSDLILNKVETLFENPTKDRTAMLNAVKELRDKVNTMLTRDLDEIYHSLTLKDRKSSLINSLTNLLGMVNNGDKQTIRDLSEIYGVKNNQLEVLNALGSDLIRLQNGDEKDYNEIFDKMELTSQTQAIAELYTTVISNISSGDNDEIIIKFMEANNIEVADDETPVLEKLDEIKDKINYINSFIRSCEASLRITDRNGNVIISASPEDAVIKSFEKKGIIPRERDLRELQLHLEKIVKDKSSDEFQSRQGKLKDKSLYKFSASETNALKKYERDIFPMYAYVQKELNSVRNEMKDILEELKRIIGLNEGSYWVTNEGYSGLRHNEQVRILEYMTGRSYYKTDDIKKGIEKIKDGAYSGISSSSVFHDKIGGHAQYIADITPVKIKVKDKNGNIREKTREVLFQDNSWGASEKENTWIDSYGLERTDYSDNRGGTLGYITNEEFRNGNFVDRILHEMIAEEQPQKVRSRVYKHLKPEKSEYKMPQYYDIILEGKSPKLKSITDEIHDAMFVPNTDFIEYLEIISTNYNYDELKAMINSLQKVGKTWKNTYTNLLHRIFPPFGKGIETLEDYEKLADDDYLKVVLEKIALKKAYQIAGREPELAKVRNVTELQNFKNGQKARAINNFRYSFAKSLNITDYIASKFSLENERELDAIYDKYNLNLTEDKKLKIEDGFGINYDEFDGSLAHSIDLYIANLGSIIDEIIVVPEAIKEVKDYFRNFFTKTLYFNESDINNKKIEHIIKFIDREFDPEDNKELVKIYRKIQDMTTEEFKKEILPRIRPEDIGMQTLTGYDILQRIKFYDEQAEKDFINTIYYDSIVPELNSEEYKAEYSYKKLYRVHKYKTTYNFNTLYRNLSADLSCLTYPKMFNRYKGRNLKQYGAYPAYPKLDYLSEEFINTSYNSYIDIVEDSVRLIRSCKQLLQNYDIVHKFEYYTKKLQPDSILSDYQYKRINYLAGLFLTLNYGDTTIPEATKAAEEILELPKGTEWEQYTKLVQTIIDVGRDLENTTSIDTINKLIEKQKKVLSTHSDALALGFIQDKYQDTIRETMNKLKQAMVRNQTDKIDEYKAQLYNEFTKYHLMNDPNELLEKYILSCPEQSPINKYNDILETQLTRGLIYAKLAQIQDILMEAIGEGLDMDAKSMFKTYSLKLKDGSTAMMDSGDMISHMVHKMLIDNQSDTALMFMDKLGFGELYIEHMAKTFNYEEIKKTIKKIIDLGQNYQGFNNEVAPLTEVARQEIENNNENAIKTINRLKKDIIQIGKKYYIDTKDIKIFLIALDHIKANYISIPNSNKTTVFCSVINDTVKNFTENINAKLNSTHEIIDTNYSIVEMINNIALLDEDSDAYKAREEINKNFEEIAEYEKELMDLQASENSDKI